MALRRRVFGKMIIVDLHTRKGYRVSPGVNKRAAAIGKCARGKSKAQAMDCFDTVGSLKGKATKK